MATTGTNNPLESLIRQKLTSHFVPEHLEILNESFMHNVPKGSETHFKVLVVSNKFDSLSLLQRHRLVNETLQDELKNGVHALSIVFNLLTDQGWAEKQLLESPPIGGNMKTLLIGVLSMARHHITSSY
uniref:EOG090X0K4K n=1 Tax=Eubosmina coregoni TaxID=186181 RepID=A0A4Y7LLW5_9CRUS|nr:EOG090X0K4K [Eubosmina coregoni]